MGGMRWEQAIATIFIYFNKIINSPVNVNIRAAESVSASGNWGFQTN